MERNLIAEVVEMVLCMVSEPWWSNGYEFEFYHFYLFDKKNQVQDNVSLCKFKLQRTFI